MTTVTFEEVYASVYVRDSVNSIMDTLVRQYPMLKSHDDDIRQRLWIILNRQLPQFNPAKCSIESYARMTLDSAVKEIRRSYLSPRNVAKHMYVPMDDDNNESPIWIDENGEQGKFFAVIREAVAILPPVEQEICRMLMAGDSMDTIRIKLKISYKTLLSKYIPHIKNVLGENIF